MKSGNNQNDPFGFSRSRSSYKSVHKVTRCVVVCIVRAGITAADTGISLPVVIDNPGRAAAKGIWSRTLRPQYTSVPHFGPGAEVSEHFGTKELDTSDSSI